jgi:DNA (cytosine-5)-methyltransferase 1
MKKYRILNLYACLGGNRYKWDEVSDNIEITAVELDPVLAELYQMRFPSDTVLIADAHQYLLDNYKSFDFIWSSPPCPSHSRARFARRNTTKSAYPDMSLYQEIIFLSHWFPGKYVVENVIPYYKPLIPARQRGRHLFWTNFNLPANLNERPSPLMASDGELAAWCAFHEFDFYQYKGKQRVDKIARNMVDFEAGRTIFETAIRVASQSTTRQVLLFDALP